MSFFITGGKIKVSSFRFNCQRGSIDTFCQIIRGDEIREGVTEIGQFTVLYIQLDSSPPFLENHEN